MLLRAVAFIYLMCDSVAQMLPSRCTFCSAQPTSTVTSRTVICMSRKSHGMRSTKMMPAGFARTPVDRNLTCSSSERSSHGAGTSQHGTI